jgi:hypothetical protein
MINISVTSQSSAAGHLAFCLSDAVTFFRFSWTEIFAEQHTVLLQAQRKQLSFSLSRNLAPEEEELQEMTAYQE